MKQNNARSAPCHPSLPHSYSRHPQHVPTSDNHGRVEVRPPSSSPHPAPPGRIPPVKSSRPPLGSQNLAHSISTSSILRQELCDDFSLSPTPEARPASGLFDHLCENSLPLGGEQSFSFSPDVIFDNLPSAPSSNSLEFDHSEHAAGTRPSVPGSKHGPSSLDPPPTTQIILTDPHIFFPTISQ